MRKLIAAAVLAAAPLAAVAGFSTAASAGTVNPSATSYCRFNPADPQCRQTPPGAPGFCSPTSFGFHGTCLPDTLPVFRFRQV